MECGTPDIPISTLIQQKQNFIASVSVSGILVPRIPVWVFVLQNNGTSFNTLAGAESSIAGANQFFENVFEFTICGSTMVNSSAYYDLKEADISSMLSLGLSLSPPEADNCLKVFICNSIEIILTGPTSVSALTRGPTAPGNDFQSSLVMFTAPSAGLAAHEFGHYFGLPHTFQGGQSQQIVSHNPLICWNTGDSFCDTEADHLGCAASNQCSSFSCDPLLDPLGTPYAPDLTLLMGNYQGCNYRFSNEQIAYMRGTFSTIVYEPLRNGPNSCLISAIGRVERNCENVPNSLFVTYPIANQPIEIRSNSNCVSLTNVDGVYQNNPSNCNLTNIDRRLLPQRDMVDIDDDTDPAQFLHPLNGVTTSDLVLISKHILGIEPLPNAFCIVAADANYSASITTTDIIEIRKVILGINKNYPIGSWRYIPKIWLNDPVFAYQFYDWNPFDAQFNDPFQGFNRKYRGTDPNYVHNLPNNQVWIDHVSLFLDNPNAYNESSWSFVGVKVGDVNCTSDTEEFSPESPDNHSFSLEPASTSNISLKETKTIEIVAHSPTSGVSSWQFGVSFPGNNLELLQLLPGDAEMGFEADNFAVKEATPVKNGTLKALWFSADGSTIDLDGKVLFSLQAKAKQNVSNILNAFSLDATEIGMKFYDENGAEIPDVTLSIRLQNSTAFRPASEDRSILLNTGPKFSCKAFPAPFDSELSFDLTIKTAELIEIEIYDISGNLIHVTKEHVDAGSKLITLADLQKMPGGVYFYTVKAGAEIAQGKLLKL